MVLAVVASDKVASLLVACSAVLVYVNTFQAEFSFDDNFAVVNNGDVTNPGNPLLGLLRHDFWGQDIRSHSSHKSYRPVTVLSFRIIRQTWQALPQDVQRLLFATNEAFPFHVINVLLHGVVSLLVYRLACHFFSLKELFSAPLGSSSPPTLVEHPQDSVSPFKGDVVCGLAPHMQRPAQLQALLCGLAFSLHPAHTEAVAGVVGHAEVLCALFGILSLLAYFRAADARYLTASMFQLPEPGKVLSLPGDQAEWGDRAHWKLLLWALGMAWLSAFSKEVGITVVGCMMVYDLLELGAPLRQWHVGRLFPSGRGADGCTLYVPAALRSQLLLRKVLRLLLCGGSAAAYVMVRGWVAGDHLVRIYREVENPIPFCPDRWTRIRSTGWLHCRYFGLLLLPHQLSADWSFKCLPLVHGWGDWRNSLTALLYLGMLYCFWAARFWDGGLVSLGFWPPAKAGPPILPPTSSSGGGGSRSSRQAAAAAAAVPTVALAAVSAPPNLQYWRWLLGVVVGLIVAPFFPASNVLFYVGTVIGERLLYMPSVGYCILLADLVHQLLSRLQPAASPTPLPSPAQPTPDSTATTNNNTSRSANSSGKAPPATAAATTAATTQNTGGAVAAGGATGAAAGAAAGAAGGSAGAESGEGKRGGRAGSVVAGVLRLLGSMLVCALVSVMLGWYCARTFTRNWDWQSEEKLFLSAMQVCPSSAKVQLNNGILQRRFHNMDAALAHFEEARRLVPTYCEPAYWVGITLLNTGKMLEAVGELETAIGCKYVAVEAVMALNTIFKVLREANPRDVAPMLRWGQILLHPDLQRVADACVVLEEAALVMAAAHNLTGAYTATQQCMEVLKARVGKGEGVEPLTLQERLQQAQALAFDKPAAPLPPTDTDLRGLYECVKARSIVYGSMAKHGLLSKSVKRHMYRYLHSHAAACRSSPMGPTSHTQLVNRLQSADAYDPWLHIEWAEVLAISHPPRIAEGCTHLQAAAALLLSVPLKPAGGDGDSAAPAYQPVPGAPTTILALDGEGPVSGRAAVDACIRALQRALELGTGHIDTCQILSNLCEARLQLLQLLPSGGVAYASAQVKAAECIQELFAQPLCHAQRARFTQQATGPGQVTQEDNEEE